ncbi:hypothetical protein DFO73_10374 [Cytobacillus oceanisediminis]|jgi:hypothetical protein|uniref:Uncharacterized protein n=1 Tax=Cytobacillus oceanisediminis TaxID=665099 RepID=A0A2V3A0E2_9BACI|nr:hypothetical protein [Cytobacillus oceanisediminis]PWW30192.1 hypothetical protein DFO73_10374 [Cytobacillus oceanisediminis]
MITALLWLSFALSLISLIAGIMNQSWKLAFFSSILLLPLAFYLSGAENGLRYLMFLPAVPFILAIIYFFQTGQKGQKQKGN